MRPPGCTQVALGAALLALAVPVDARADTLTGNGSAILTRILKSDSWGLSDAEIQARAVVHESNGSVRTVVFTAQSRTYDGNLTKSFVRIMAPPDLNGVKFLQIQRHDDDDERYIYLPELRRVRRVAGKSRAGSFMTTDFSYADIDRRDLRVAEATLDGDEKVGNVACHRLIIVPKGADAQYSRIVVSSAVDTDMIMKALMYDLRGKHTKTLTVDETRNVSGRWYVTRARMESHADGRATTLTIEKLVPSTKIPDEIFTQRNLERG
jgi:outer membrane lipoprotein-sorting protein